MRSIIQDGSDDWPPTKEGAIPYREDFIMKKMYVKRLLAGLTVLTLLSGTVSGCGMNMTGAAPAAATDSTATESAANDTAATAASDEAYNEVYEEAPAEEYEENADYETEEANEALYDLAVENSINADNGYAASEKAAAGTCLDAAYDNSRSYEQSSMKQNSDDTYLTSIYDYDEDEYYSDEEYADLTEQGYKSVVKAPLSTFAADVDTASYSNLRRLIADGYSVYNLPQNSVRIEELINYFNYNYDEPKGSDPFSVNTTLSACPWNKDAMLLSLGLKTEDIDFTDTPDSNLVFLIDVSGSMADYDKLPLLQEAFCMLVDELSDKDRVSIVTYANGVDTVLSGEKGSNGRKIKMAINNLFAGGGTNGGEGIQTAYKLAEKNFIKGGNNRVILATDGDLNIGLTSVDELEDLISLEKESGVYLSVLGFGSGNLKDNRMEALADKGNGNYSYIDSVKEAKKVMVDELSSNLLTVCKDVKLQVEFNPEVIRGYRLLGYSDRVMKNKDFNDDKKDGGEIGAGHEVTALYELIPVNSDTICFGDDDVDVDSLKYADEFRRAGKKSSKKNYKYDTISSDAEMLTLSIRYKKPSGDKSNLLTYPVRLDEYTYSPSDDFLFQSAVAEFGLIASNSAHKGDADIDNVIDRLESIRLNDEYKAEFLDLVKEAR